MELIDEYLKVAAIVKHLEILAVNACPWIQRRVHTVAMDASTLAEMASDEKILWFLRTAFDTCFK